MTDYQKEIYQAVVDRGYRKGWTAREFLGRNIAKLQEELAELSYIVLDPNYCKLAPEIEMVGTLAKQTFDDLNKKHWKQATEQVSRLDLPKLYQEIADIQVVLFCTAEALAQMSGKNFNLLFWALRKAENDAERGVRDDLEL